MKHTVIFVIGLLICRLAFAQQVPVIPLPNAYKKAGGVFNLSSQTPVLAPEAAQPLAHYLQKELLRTSGLALGTAAESKLPAIILQYSRKEKNPEAYRLQMSARSVTISAAHNTGLFHGITSLLQLIRQTPVKHGILALDCWEIQDAPRYSWRGFMLDESRHFFGKEKVKSLLDWMAFYKLNRFHWHLTDQHGWRLEIRQYPRLGLVGGIGNFSNRYAPGQFYTQEDIKEIVAYAAERHITVIPEIDMPGHASAANLAYPEYSGGGSKNYPEFTFNPGKEGTYQYLTNILKEADVLFPSQMIHLGGDEVHFGNENWNRDQAVQSLMKTRQLPDLKAVEGYFIRRMADSVQQLQNKVLAWDEAVELELPVRNTIIFWWRHDKPQQLKQALAKGYATVLCPRLPFYFDFVQDSTHRFGRRWKGGFNPLESVYQFDADQIPETAGKNNLILGIQANLWTETVPDEQRLDFLLFPRICGLAEAAWTESRHKDFKLFEKRLNSQLPLLSKAGLYYFDPAAVQKYAEPSPGESKFNNNLID